MKWPHSHTTVFVCDDRGHREGALGCHPPLRGLVHQGAIWAGSFWDFTSLSDAECQILGVCPDLGALGKVSQVRRAPAGPGGVARGPLCSGQCV